ncbi:HSP20-like chaperone [Trichoderma novae-zelandiae]
MLRRSLIRSNNHKNRIVKHLSSSSSSSSTSSIATRHFSTTPKMAFFQRNFYPETSFTPLFRLLQDFDDYSRQNNGGSPAGGRRSGLAPWQPKFDVRETDSAYELHGELPGMSKENVNIEFSDSQTLVVHGRVERTYTAGTPPSGAIEGARSGGAITEGGEKDKKAHKATVEDEDAAGKSGDGQQQQQQVSKRGDEGKDNKPADKAKYWLSERSVGEFSRTFSFPSRVDQDKVTANFKDGILSITIPKAAKHEPKKIAVN